MCSHILKHTAIYSDSLQEQTRTMRRDRIGISLPQQQSRDKPSPLSSLHMELLSHTPTFPSRIRVISPGKNPGKLCLFLLFIYLFFFHRTVQGQQGESSGKIATVLEPMVCFALSMCNSFPLLFTQ